MGTHMGSALWELCGGNTENIDGRTVFYGFESYDEAACVAVNLYIEHLAAGITNIINILEPELFCIGGGISNAWDHFAEPLKALVDKEKYFRFSPQLPHTKIVKAKLGNDAGIIGAAML